MVEDNLDIQLDSARQVVKRIFEISHQEQTYLLVVKVSAPFNFADIITILQETQLELYAYAAASRNNGSLKTTFVSRVFLKANVSDVLIVESKIYCHLMEHGGVELMTLTPDLSFVEVTGI